MFNLSRYFSILSLILIGLAAGLLGLMYREASVRQMTTLAEDRNLAMAQVFENALGESLAELMDASIGKDASMLQQSEESLGMRNSLTALLRRTAVVNVKIYNRLGVTVFSTDSTQIGDSNLDNPGFKTALSGVVTSELRHHKEMETFDGTRSNIDLLASFIPVAGEGQGFGEVVGSNVHRTGDQDTQHDEEQGSSTCDDAQPRQETGQSQRR